LNTTSARLANWAGSRTRAAAGHLLRSRDDAAIEISLPRTTGSHEWLSVALVECDRCHQVIGAEVADPAPLPSSRTELKMEAQQTGDGTTASSAGLQLDLSSRLGR
jgi:hypothetical protein